MTKTKRLANELRKQIASPEIDFDFWVRKWRDGGVWVGPNYGSARRCEVLCSRLHALGYETAMNGKPGTSGEYVIEIVGGPGITNEERTNHG